MSLGPNFSERLARARADLRAGVPVVVGNTLVCAAETLSADRLADLRKMVDLSLALTYRRAETLKARAYDTGFARIVLPEDQALDWVRQMADPALDLSAPMKGPFRSRRDDDAGDAGLAFGLLKSAMLLPAALVAPVEHNFAQRHELTQLDPALLRGALDTQASLREIASARVPLAAYPDTRVHVFRPDTGGDEHYAIRIGRPAGDAPVLTRLHSACFTGDLLGSLKCDCGPQLRAALDLMAAEGAGILLYLNQEGRGIGLANKMRAYALQDQGFDTVEANHRLGFEDDERDFRIGSSILTELGPRRVRLLTNNPAKVAMLGAHGIDVTERVPLRAGRSAQNASYLDTKSRKSGHLM